jgi:hypothetical protein
VQHDKYSRYHAWHRLHLCVQIGRSASLARPLILELKAYFWMIERCSSPLCLNGKRGKCFLTSWNGTLLGTGTTPEGTKNDRGCVHHRGPRGRKTQGNCDTCLQGQSPSDSVVIMVSNSSLVPGLNSVRPVARAPLLRKSVKYQ